MSDSQEGTLDAFIGRQPIYDRNMEVFGYELLYRPGAVARSNVTDGDSATSQVLVNAFIEIGLDRLVGGKCAFFNLTESFLQDPSLIPFAPDQIVLEILEDIPITDETIRDVRSLADRGYTMALDDFVMRPEWEPLIDLCSIIKVELPALNEQELREHFSILSQRNVKLLAEKVETPEEYALCRDLGFDLFQGYFFCKPDVMQGKRLGTNRLATMRLLARLQDPAVETGELEQLIGQDVSLSYRLLRLINSAQFGVRQKVESVRQALVLLGLAQVRSWTNLIALTGIDDKPHELLKVAMTRAGMCRKLVESRMPNHADAAFTVGLFSSMDAFFDMPIGEIVAELPLSNTVEDALTQHSGILGETLKSVLAYEQGHWDESLCSETTPEEMRTIYLDSLFWADEILSAVA